MTKISEQELNDSVIETTEAIANGEVQLGENFHIVEPKVTRRKVYLPEDPADANLCDSCQ